ncbi:lipopolysaccharide biosynthesis protein [Halobacteria archaeon HArc-gm2]|nr:lipopolysaccharide biosynthesis protein [Halobacteria archaeon HArc-gm2]
MLDTFRDLYHRITTGGSTQEQAIQSGIWVAGINVSDRILQILNILILARLLSPNAFGLFGIALLVVAALRKMSQLGFDQALIQLEKENIDSYLSTLWVMKIVRGAVIFGFAFVVAPYLATFFGEPQAERLIRVIGITPLILSLQNPAVVYFRKDLNFDKEFVYQVGSSLLKLVVATVMALVFRSVWALVAGIVAANFAKLVLSYGIHEYRPSIEFNWEYGKEMFDFGKWIFASSILVFLYGQGDDAFVGWFFTATSLGFYQIAYRFSNAPATEVTHVISRVAFPAFSKVQTNIAKLREGYFRTVELSTIIAFPMAAGIIAVTPQFVPIVLGSQWQPVIPIMQLLAIWGALRSFGASIGPVYKSLGRPDVEVKLQAIQTAIIVIGIYPAATNFGLLGVAGVIIVSSITVLPMHLSLVSSFIEADITSITALVIHPVLGSTALFGVVWAIGRYGVPLKGAGKLAALIAVGVVVYLSYMAFIAKATDYDPYTIFREIFESI